MHDRLPVIEGPPLTVSDVCARTGLARAEVLGALRAGRIPGAYRVPGGAWSIPPAAVSVLLAPATTPAPALVAPGPGRESLDTDSLGRSGFDRTPAPQLSTLLDTARRVDRALDGLGTRAARVAPAAVWSLVESAAVHTLGRDGLCTRCAWQWPCPDYAHAATAVERAAALLLEGDS